MIKRLTQRLIIWFLSKLPITSLYSINRVLLKLGGISVGNRVRVVSTSRFISSGKISIGEDTWVGHDAMFIGGGAGIAIGANCDIAPRVTFSTGTHKVLKGENKVAGEGYSEKITVSDGCWICTGATLLHGTEIGRCSIVAAGAVVKGKFPARVLIGGTPARIISSLE